MSQKKINLVLSSHRITDAQNCLQYYCYRHEALKGPNKTEIYLDAGEMMHAMLKIHYTGIMHGEPVDPNKIVELGRNVAAKGDLEAEEVEVTVKDFLMYISHYGKDDRWEILGVERPFIRLLLETKEYRVFISGINDLIVRPKNMEYPVIIVDHKYEKSFYQKSPRDNQPLAYCWGTGTRDFLYNRIGKQKTKKPEDRLKREPYFCYSKEQIEDWEQSVAVTALKIIEADRSNYYPMSYSACLGSFAKKCIFHRVCETSRDQRYYQLQLIMKDIKPYDLDLFLPKEDKE